VSLDNGWWWLNRAGDKNPTKITLSIMREVIKFSYNGSNELVLVRKWNISVWMISIATTEKLILNTID
jgi:hypothetical protein